MHAVIPFGDNDTETSQTLQRLLTDAWLRPYMRPRWLKVDPHRAQISDEFTNWCEQRGIEVVDSAGKAKEQQGKVEHHAQLFELMLKDVLADVQHEWRECLDALPEAKNSLLSVSGVSPMQLVFGRSPEIPGDLLSDNPDLIANSSILHDRGASQAARVGTLARTKLMLQSDKLNARRALDTRPRVVTDVPSTRHGCSVAHDEGRWHAWEASASSLETWNMHGRSARQLLDYPPWKRHQGVSGTAEACGKGKKTCLATGGGRTADEARELRRVLRALFWRHHGWRTSSE